MSSPSRYVFCPPLCPSVPTMRWSIPSETVGICGAGQKGTLGGTSEYCGRKGAGSNCPDPYVVPHHNVPAGDTSSNAFAGLLPGASAAKVPVAPRTHMSTLIVCGAS